MRRRRGAGRIGDFDGVCTLRLAPSIFGRATARADGPSAGGPTGRRPAADPEGQHRDENGQGASGEGRSWRMLPRPAGRSTVPRTCQPAGHRAPALPCVSMSQQLVEGLQRFRRESFPKFREHYQRLVDEGQSPNTLFIGCADSRVVPDLLTSTLPGRPVRGPQRRQPGAAVRDRRRLPRRLGRHRVRDGGARGQGHRDLRPQPLWRDPRPVQPAARRRAAHVEVAGAGPSGDDLDRDDRRGAARRPRCARSRCRSSGC